LPPGVLPKPEDDIIQPTIVWQHEIASVIKKDAVSIVITCYRILEGFRLHLLGIQKTKKKMTANFSSQPRGLFGVAKADLWVHELTGRKVIHFHGLAWVGLPQWLIQRLATSEQYSRHMTNLFQKLYHTSAAPELHVAHLFRRLHNIRYVNPAYFTPPSVDMTVAEMMRMGEAVATSKNVHSHCLTCKHGFIGCLECRLAYERPTDESEVPRVLEAKTVDNNLFVQGKEKTPNLLPIPEDDNDEMMQRLGLPGGHMELLDFPLSRPIITVHDLSGLVFRKTI
jgi:hypothetical protein